MAQASLSVPPPKPVRVGRPTLLTPELQEGICNLIRKGNRPAEAAGCFGIDGATYWRWIQRGKKDEEPFCEFRKAVNSAVADAKDGLVALMRKAAEADPKHWKAAQAILERFDPKPLQGAVASATSGMPVPLAARIDDEAFWSAFRKDTLTRVALLEERDRVLAERQKSEPLLAASAVPEGTGGDRKDVSY